MTSGSAAQPSGLSSSVGMVHAEGAPDSFRDFLVQAWLGYVIKYSGLDVDSRAG